MKKIALLFSIGLVLALLATVVVSQERLAKMGRLQGLQSPQNAVADHQKKEPKLPDKLPESIEKWGYMDASGKLVIPPRFRDALPFTDGVAQVTVDEPETGYGIGYINQKGQFVIAPKLKSKQFVNQIWEFSEGRLPLRQESGGKIGYINKQGQFVIPPQFSKVESYFNGRAMVCWPEASQYEEKCGYINRTGALVIPPRFPAAWSFHQGAAAVSVKGQGQRTAQGVLGLIDRLGNYLVEPILDQINTLPEWGNPPDVKFDDGLVRVRVVDGVGDTSYSFNPKWAGKWGYVSQKGGFAIPPQFTRAENFSEGRALVKIPDDATGYDPAWRGQWALIDTTGKLVYTPGQKPQPYCRSEFHEGLALAHTKESDSISLVGYIDREGRWVILPKFPGSSSIGNFSQGLAAAPDPKNGKYGYIDRTGEFVIPPKFDLVYDFADNGWARVTVKNKYGLIDKTGRFVLEPKYHSISEFVEGVALISPIQGGDSYYFNSSGQILPYSVSGVRQDFSEGLVPVIVKVSPSSSRE